MLGFSGAITATDLQIHYFVFLVNRQILNLLLGLSGAITAALTLCGHPAKPGNELLDQMWNTKVSDLKHKSCFFPQRPVATFVSFAAV